MSSRDPSSDQQDRSATMPETQGGLGGAMHRLEDRVTDAGDDALQAVDGRRSAAADSLDGMASRLHNGADKAADLGHKGGEKVSHFAHGAADKVQAGADFVREHDARAMMTSVEGYVRRNPGQALLAAGVVGFLAARLVRRD